MYQRAKGEVVLTELRKMVRLESLQVQQTRQKSESGKADWTSRVTKEWVGCNHREVDYW